MSVDSPHPILRDAQRYSRAWRWFLLLLLLACVAKIFLDEHWRAVQNHYQVREQAKVAVATSMPRVIPDLFTQSHATDGGRGSWTKAEVEKRVNGGKPLIVRSIGNELERFDWIDPASQNQWTLNFQQGRWVSFSGLQYVGWAKPPEHSVLYVLAEQCRRAWLVIGPWIWCALFIIVVYFKRLRDRLLVNLLLAVALLNTAAWFTHANYTASLRGIASNDNLLFGVIMILISVPICRHFRFAIDPADLGLCRRCRYDLTGNESGVCPECGENVARVATRARTTATTTPAP